MKGFYVNVYWIVMFSAVMLVLLIGLALAWPEIVKIGKEAAALIG